MIRRSTWVMLAVFGVLLVFAIWWTQRGGTAPPEAQVTPTLEPMWAVDASEIAAVLVEDLASGVRVEARREASQGWVIVLPEAGQADVGRVERAVLWLANPVPRASIVEPEDLSPFGLDQPGKRVTATLADGQTLIFEVGEEAPTGTVSYVRVVGRPGVLVVSKYGLSEVLGLLDPLPLVTPTASPSPVATEAPTPQATP